MKKKLFCTNLLLILFVISISAQSYEWKSLPLGGAGFVTGIITCPQEKGLIYARTDVGGAYRWNEAGNEWISISNWIPEQSTGYLGIESLAIDPQSPNKLYIYCGTSYWSSGKSAIIYSEDYGTTWEEKAIVTQNFPSHGNDYGRQSGERLAVDPNLGSTLLCGSRTKGLWKSTNGASSWTRIGKDTFKDNQKVAFVQFIAESGTKGEATPTIYVGLQVKSSENLFVSNDNGETWEAVENQPTKYRTHRCLYSNGKLYITYSDSEGPGSEGTGAIYRYDIAEKSWTDISPEQFSFGEVTVDPTDPNKLMCTTQGLWRQQSWISGTTTWGDQIYLSEDDGSTWKNLFPSNCTFSEPNIIWLQKNSQLHWAGSAKIDPFNRNRAFIISGNGIYTTENLWDAKPSWKMALKGLEETVPLDFASMPGSPFVTAVGDYDGCVYHDINKYYPRHSPSMGTTSGIAIAGKKIEHMVRVGSTIYYTSNGGKNWNEIKKPTNNASSGSCSISADGSIIYWTPSSGRGYYTLDQGENWNYIPGITDTNIRLVADPDNEKAVYTYSGGKLWSFLFNSETKTFNYTQASVSKGLERIAIVPGFEGEVWIARNLDGLSRVQKATSSDAKITNLKLVQAKAIGTGKAAPGKNYPSLYIWGQPTTNDQVGVYRSDDEGKSWVRINDNLHQFGGLGNAQSIKGDMNTYGQVYLSTVGLGTIVGKNIEATSSIYEVKPGRNINSYQNGDTLAFVASSEGSLAKFTSETLPEGMAIDQATGLIFVSDAASLTNGTHSFSVSATSADANNSYDISISIKPDMGAVFFGASCNIDVITNGFVLASGSDGNGSFTATISSGDLPEGTEVSPCGTIVVTNSDLLKAGSYALTFTTKDSSGGSSSVDIVINIFADTEAVYVVNESKKRDRYTRSNILATVTDADGAIVSATIVAGELPTGTALVEKSGIIAVANASLLVTGSYPLSIKTVDSTGGITINEINIVFDPATGFETMDNQNLKVEPTLFFDKFSISSNYGTIKYSIFNLSGQLLESGQGNGNVNAGASIPEGFYILQVTNGKYRKTEKIKKEIL